MLAVTSYAQSRVFKAVSSEMSSQFRAITQDGILVGYIAATQLEKVTKDSFSYKIEIMDENLNDIGTVNFRDLWLRLQDVSLEGDVLCLSYVKTDLFGREFKLAGKFRKEAASVDVFVFNQFLNLDGKIIGQQQQRVEVDLLKQNNGLIPTNIVLPLTPELRNIPGTGFALFYGDERTKMVVAYTGDGRKLWEKKILEDNAKWYSLLTTASEVYLLEKKQSKILQGGYSVYSYAAANGKAFPVYRLEDKEGMELRVTGFDIDQKTGRPFVSGSILHEKKAKRQPIASRISSGLYRGVFTVNFNGPTKKEIKTNYSFWDEGGISEFSPKGQCIPAGSYMELTSSFKDFDGNTYFSGTAMQKKFNPGSIILAPFGVVALAPLSPIRNCTKYNLQNGVVLKQDSTGKLKFNSTIPGTKGFILGQQHMMFLSKAFPLKEFYTVSNSDTKGKYLIMRDFKKTVIFDVNLKKVLREIPARNKDYITTIYPAKEGHILVSEFDKKEKSTRISIESL